MTMALVKHDRSKHEVTSRRQDFFDRFFDEWPELLRRRSFLRDLTLPKGTAQADVKASYKDGILEVRVPAPAQDSAPVSVKVPIDKG